MTASGRAEGCRSRGQEIRRQGNASQPLRRTRAALRASASLRVSPAFRDLPPAPREVPLLVPRPRKRALVFLGRGRRVRRRAGFRRESWRR